MFELTYSCICFKWHKFFLELTCITKHSSNSDLLSWLTMITFLYIWTNDRFEALQWLFIIKVYIYPELIILWVLSSVSNMLCRYVLCVFVYEDVRSITSQLLLYFCCPGSYVLCSKGLFCCIQIVLWLWNLPEFGKCP